MPRKLGVLALMIASCLAFAANGFATECTTEYTWKCADKSPNDCVGYFHGTHGAGDIETFQESNPDLECGEQEPGHSLLQVLRFSGLPKGSKEVRMSYGSQNVCGAGTETEVLQILKRVVNGCDESGLYQVVTELGPEGASETDYSLGVSSGYTDICLAFESQETSEFRDEFYISHGSGHSHPIVVTTLDTLYYADSEATGEGSKSGTYQNTLTSDNVREQLTEGGTNHRLFHVYQINRVPAGSSQTLKVEGYRPNNADGDNFQILFKWIANGSNCPTSGMFQGSGITINSSTESVYSASVGSSSGTLCVAVDDTTGGTNNDSVYIDHLYVEVTNPSCP